MNKEKLKVKIFLILSLVFAILTLIGGYLVITHKLDNAGYSVIQLICEKIKNNLNGGFYEK